jgi:hypothetical protein
MRYSDFKIVEGKGEAMLAKVDMLLQNTGFARKGFEIVKAPQQGSIRGSITDEALDAIKATLAKAKAMGATEPEDPIPTISKADITDKDFTESQAEVYVIGDSHAKAMGGSNNLASNGARLRAIVGQARRVPRGSTVYMTGGHNDVPAGLAPQRIALQVRAIIAYLEEKDCKVNYILFPEGTDNTNQDNMAPTRDAIKQMLTSLQDLDGCSLQGDGIHCTLGSYRGIVSSTPTSSTRDTEDEGGLEAGPPYPKGDIGAVKDMQRKLQDLSYAVGNTGVDGKYGPRTTRAVRAFKADYDISTPATKMSAEELRILASAEPKEDPTPVRAPSRGREGGGRRARSALGFFIEKGLSPAQSAGIVGNLQAESGQNLDPSAVGDGGQAHGIAQWHPPRRRNFQRAFGKPFSESSFEEQLEFIWWELNNTERRAMRLLRRAESAEQAAYIFDKYYERSSGAHRRRRMQYAARLLADHTGTAVV